MLLLWAGMLVGSLYSFRQMKIGLEQDLVLPTGSYLKTYFDQQATLGEAGPPVYIVLQNVNYSHPDVRRSHGSVCSVSLWWRAEGLTLCTSGVH